MTSIWVDAEFWHKIYDEYRMKVFNREERCVKSIVSDGLRYIIVPNFLHGHFEKEYKRNVYNRDETYAHENLEISFSCISPEMTVFNYVLKYRIKNKYFDDDGTPKYSIIDGKFQELNIPLEDAEQILMIIRLTHGY